MYNYMIHSIASSDKVKLLLYLEKHNLKPIKPIVIYKNMYRATINHKKYFKSFSTIVLSSGIHVIIGYK